MISRSRCALPSLRSDCITLYKLWIPDLEHCEFRSKMVSITTGSPLKSGIFGRARGIRSYKTINWDFIITNLLELVQNSESIFFYLGSNRRGRVFARTSPNPTPVKEPVTEKRLRRDNAHQNRRTTDMTIFPWHCVCISKNKRYWNVTKFSVTDNNFNQ